MGVAKSLTFSPSSMILSLILGFLFQPLYECLCQFLLYPIMLFSLYHWETCFFVKENSGGVFLREKGDKMELDGEQRGEPVVGMYCMMEEQKNVFMNLFSRKVALYSLSGTMTSLTVGSWPNNGVKY